MVQKKRILNYVPNFQNYMLKIMNKELFLSNFFEFVPISDWEYSFLLEQGI
jgi:hypothetical protein